ncbi:MAG: SBBP repeat-containing protein [Acidobacteriia bacterium]|nr:SBBP repeat-containing protein [Terriglobia bacterium]
MTLNFRGLGTRYCPVLLWFALLLLGGVALHSAAPASQLSASVRNSSVPASFAAPDLASNRPSVRVDLGQLPLRFEPNQGQTDPRVNFLARGAGYGLFLTPDQAILTLHPPSKNPAVVRMQLAGANRAAAAAGASPLPGKSNYFIGNDAAKWHRNIPQFARVRYQDVYPGVDLVYYGSQGQLEYDFEVAPGADPSSIAWRFQGQEKARLDGGGNLVLATGNGEVRLNAPRIYQQFGAEQRPVAGRFAFRQDGKVGFELAAYDRRRALVIDPVLTYSTYFGGSGSEACSGIAGIVIAGVLSPPSGCPAIAIDASSNIYFAGTTTSADFPVVPAASATPHAFQTALAVAPDVFVTKLNAAGSTVVFSTYLGGDGVDTTAGVAADSAFNVVVAGTTTSTNFPTSSASAFQATPAGAGAHAFVSQLDPVGETLLYSTYLSGNGTESARGLALDPRNKIYVIGATTSTNQPDATHSFPATLGAIQTASLGTSQFFVSKIDPTLIGSPSLVYSTYFGGGDPLNGVTLGGGIAVDANANVYITGGTNFQHTGSATTDFPILNAYQGCLDTPPPATPPTTAPSCSTSVTAPDAFVAKINPAAASGAQLIYSSYLGGTGDDVGYGIALDSGLSVYITGSTSSTDFTIPSSTTPFQRCLDNPANPSPCPTGVTASDAFVAKFGTPCTGSTCTTTTLPFTYFSYLGGSGTDVGLAIAVDSLQGARIAGWTNSGNFPTPNNPIQASLSGPVDVFVSRIDTTATSTLALGHYGTYLGGGGSDFGTSIATDTQGSSYIVGETASPNFPTANPIQSNLSGGSDVFLTKLGPTLSLALTETVSPNPVGVGNNVTFTYKVTNNGDLTTGIIFTDVIPSTATFVSANSVPGQSSCPAPVTSSTVTCTVGTLNGGAVATVTVVLAPTLPATPAQPGSVSDGGKVTIFGTPTVVTPAPPPAVAVVNNFSIAVSPLTTTVAAGIPASFTVTVTPTGNFPDTVTLSATGAPTGAQTTFPNGTSFTNLNSGPQSRQLVVNTTARVTTPASLFPIGGPFYAALFPVSGLALLGVGIGGRKSRRRRVLMAALLSCFFALVVFQMGCGSSSTTSTTTGTPAGTYNLTVTATSGSATRTQQIVLVVQ